MRLRWSGSVVRLAFFALAANVGGACQATQSKRMFREFPRRGQVVQVVQVVQVAQVAQVAGSAPLLELSSVLAFYEM